MSRRKIKFFKNGKVNFINFAVIILFSACNQEQDLNPANNFEKEISFLTAMNTSGLNLVVSNLGKNITPVKSSGIILNQRKLVKDMLSGLNGHYFHADEKTIVDFASNYGELRLPDQLANARKAGTVDLSTFEIYSKSQLDLVQPFIDDILDEEDFNIAKSKAIAFQQKVINSSLSFDEKIQLLSFSSGVISFAEFVENGGIEQIQIILAEEIANGGSPNGRVKRCSVSARNVWLGAVVGLGAGAVGGAKVGCAGGLVAGPLGAAGGCVGGAVMGGAMGFIGGALTTTAAELLGSCFRLN